MCTNASDASKLKTSCWQTVAKTEPMGSGRTIKPIAATVLVLLFLSTLGVGVHWLSYDDQGSSRWVDPTSGKPPQPKFDPPIDKHLWRFCPHF